MNSFNPSKIELSLKDSTKGQKIAAALYLVTAHLSDTDPLKVALRDQAVTFVGTADTDHMQQLAMRVTTMLGVAVMSRIISEKNASIIILELRHFVITASGRGDAVTDALESHFEASDDRYAALSQPVKKTPSGTSVIGHTPSFTIRDSDKKAPVAGIAAADLKTMRQEQILSFINDRKSAAIKDIALLFPDTSEKTIQRELGTLVTSGRITKRGQKRWSVYMAI